MVSLYRRKYAIENDKMILIISITSSSAILNFFELKSILSPIIIYYSVVPRSRQICIIIKHSDDFGNPVQPELLSMDC